MTNQEIVSKDLECLWHPCTQMKDHESLPLIPIDRGEGVWLYDFDGNRYLDIVSSWWVNILGHANPTINAAIKRQLDQLEHVLLAGCTHEPAVTLATRLVETTDESLTKCFFADNGSSAVEVALKMAFHYHKNLGRTKPLFVSLSNSYHGETIGALSVGDVALYKETYAEILLHSIQTPVPVDQTVEAALEAAQALGAILQEKQDEICALIVEPLIQCAGGMHMYHPCYLAEARKLCDQHGVFLIADEIATGFGRTGSLFACEQAGIAPDFLILSKGLSGGYLPIAVVLTTDSVYDCFYDDYSRYRAFLHSHSYTGNPLACAAANATILILQEENILESNRLTIAHMNRRLEQLKQFSLVERVRQQGMVGALDIIGFSKEERIGVRIYEQALRHGLLLRPLGNTLYFMPPYVITTEEIDFVFDTVEKLIGELE